MTKTVYQSSNRKFEKPPYICRLDKNIMVLFIKAGHETCDWPQNY